MGQELESRLLTSSWLAWLSAASLFQTPSLAAALSPAPLSASAAAASVLFFQLGCFLVEQQHLFPYGHQLGVIVLRFREQSIDVQHGVAFFKF